MLNVALYLCRLSELTITPKGGKSFVWKSFGFVIDKAGKRIYPDQIFCTKCFERGKMKGYKEFVSTTNLAQHLREAHGILYLLGDNTLMNSCLQIEYYIISVTHPG